MANESVSVSQHARFARGTKASQNFRFLAERWTLARLRHQRWVQSRGVECRDPSRSGRCAAGHGKVAHSAREKNAGTGRDVAGWWDRAPEQGRAAVAG